MSLDTIKNPLYHVRPAAAMRSAWLQSRAITTLAELAWPTRCVVCDQPGELLCAQCRQDLTWIEQRRACPDCGIPHGWLACTGCGGEQIHLSNHPKPDDDTSDGVWECRATICALEFSGTAALLATRLKDRYELRLSTIIAAALATALDEASSWPARDGKPRFDIASLDAVTFVPATPKAYLRRGFDHMELVACDLANFIGLPVADVLVRTSRQDQRHLNREQRRENLRGSVEVVGDVAEARLLLIDDVVTTGSTLRETSRMLLAQGAAPPTACALGRVW